MKRVIDYRINNLRAICIALVVFAHSIIAYNGSWATYQVSQSSDALKFICNFIYLFHMPLFFSLSGYLFYNENGLGRFSDLVKKKFVRLLVPFFVVGIFYMIPIRYLSQYPGYTSPLGAIIDLLIGRDGGHLWFLPALFMVFIYQYIVVKFVNNRILQDLLAVLMLAAGIFTPLYLGKALQNIIWFHAGYRIRDNKAVEKKCFGLVILLMFMVSSITCLLLPKNIIGYPFMSYTLKTAAAMSAIIAGYNLVPNKQYRVLDIISKYSFGVYLFHSPLIYVTFCYLSDLEPFVVVAINLLLMGFIALLISFIVSKSRLNFAIGMTCRKRAN